MCIAIRTVRSGLSFGKFLITWKVSARFWGGSRAILVPSPSAGPSPLFQMAGGPTAILKIVEEKSLGTRLDVGGRSFRNLRSELHELRSSIYIHGYCIYTRCKLDIQIKTKNN